MYSTGRVSLETQQSKEEGERKQISESRPPPHRAQAQPCSCMHALTPSLLPAKPKGVGGIKKGLSFPIPIGFLSMGYKKCLFAGLPFGKGKKHCPFCDTRELDLWTYSMAVGLSDECLMC